MVFGIIVDSFQNITCQDYYFDGDGAFKNIMKEISAKFPNVDGFRYVNCSNNECNYFYISRDGKGNCPSCGRLN